MIYIMVLIVLLHSVELGGIVIVITQTSMVAILTNIIQVELPGIILEFITLLNSQR